MPIGDLPRLLGFRDLTHEIDVKKPVLQGRTRNLDMVGKLEPALEGSRRNTLIEHFGLGSLGVAALSRAADQEACFPESR